ncbi:DUF4350 domain-containing protein [Geothermobacter hydrogeniphilus]|uniref:DUF4350 domain-containing protein n=1 Tax=Geothermobacter hydrogeniphilus TaxID=1969733 RepID=A0A1X0YA20_9BACT|nr:DUF4350 domain-containing protein [Geothermobacter hydrogeniphilus]ORJ62080.1 hypothetical protein B5V00_04835 [Geothermobacter hydrogeniphilus]
MSRLITIFVICLFPSLLFAAGPPRIWFDQGHGQRFAVDRPGPLQLTGFARLLAEQGGRVETGRQALDSGMLEQVDVLVLSGAFKPYRSQEIDAVERFLRGGGRLAVMLHIAPPFGDLLYRLGVDFSNGVIREREQVLNGDPLNFRVTDFADHPLTRGLQGFNLYGGWALINTDQRARVIARTGPEAWVDLNRDQRLNGNDAVQSFGVVVVGESGKGAFVVFADDAIFQNRFLPENRQLADNLVRWLLRRPLPQLALNPESVGPLLADSTSH